MCGCVSCTLSWGPGLQPRHVPWLGIKPATHWFTFQHSIHWATPGLGLYGFFTLAPAQKFWVCCLCGKPHICLRTLFRIKTELLILWTSNKASSTCCVHNTCNHVNLLRAGDWRKALPEKLSCFKGSWSQVFTEVWSEAVNTLDWEPELKVMCSALLPRKCLVFIILEASQNLCKSRTVL